MKQFFLQSFNSNSGNARVLLVFLMVCVLAGYFLISGIPPGKITPPQRSITTNVMCCNTGNGAACRPETGPGKSITYGGAEYGLLRSKIILTEGNIHLKAVNGPEGLTATGNQIVLNSSNEDNNSNALTTQGYNQYCRKNTNDDTYFKKLPTEEDKNLLKRPALEEPKFIEILQRYCTSIPNDELIFVCLKNCHPAICATGQGSCYGDEASEYDVYAKVGQEVPDFIKNCDTSFLAQGAPTVTVGDQRMVTTPPRPSTTDRNLHLKTFKFVDDAINMVVPWLSPFCKPAIYLYPEEKLSVNVVVKPQGKMLLTIPKYPEGGWNVTAYPNGLIEQSTHNSQPNTHNSFDYLYYEAEIPNESYQKPQEGFVSSYMALPSTLENLLTQLGLNEKEKKQFIEYWIHALPISSYYFIGIIPDKTLDSVSPLSISPKPKTTVRVTLYFEALDAPISVTPPTLQTPTRSGFTVVEWGGIFQRDITHPFSCFM